MADVFVSYSRSRRAEAAELANKLTDLGYSVWWDTSLLPTGPFGSEIDRQLDAAKAVIVFWSPESVRSKWVRSEAAHGDRQEKLVNIHSADLDPARQIPKPFDQIHSVGIHDTYAVVAALDHLNVSRSSGRAGPPRMTVSAAEADDRIFAEVEKDGTAEAYGYYLDQLPEGRHALLARFRLKIIQPVLPANQDSVTDGESSVKRIKVNAKITHGVPDAWFIPGNGKSEWFQDIKFGPQMIVVPAGQFMMGRNNGDTHEHPAHKVAIANPIAVGRFAVTFEEWETALAAGGVTRRLDDKGWGRGRRPVIDVSWHDARAYVMWLAKVTAKPYRLLSEAEWEYSCRAGTQTAYSTGSSISGSDANFSQLRKGSAKNTTAVGQFPPNRFGLHDMHGNVWEWCEDLWHDSYDGAPVDGSAWTQEAAPTWRVARGGSWYDMAGVITSTSRIKLPSHSRYLDGLGFRVAMSLTPGP